MCLFLCRTPFQAFVIDKLIIFLGIHNYDVVYFTYHDSDKDRFYYTKICKGARYSEYINATPASKEYIGHYLIYRKLPGWVKKKGCYDKIFLASFDNFLFRLIIRANPMSTIVTFDDGSSNILQSSKYHIANVSKGTPIYEWFFGVSSRNSVKSRISCHYTVYHGYQNIVDSSKLRYLDVFGKIDFKQSSDSKRKSFFIGQPFPEFIRKFNCSEKSFSDFIRYLKRQDIDYYLVHPREEEELDIGALEICKSDKIAEEVILDAAREAKPCVYGAFSSVMLNLDYRHVNKIYLSMSSSKGELERVEMAKKFGCSVVEL